MAIGSDFLAGLDGQPHSARIDAQSRVVPLGEAMGFFEDGWVRAQAAVSVRALDNVTSLSLELWVPPDAEQLTITMRPSNAPEITLAAPAGRVTVLHR
jgi:hypothetical protein